MVVIAMDKNKEVERIMAKIDPLFKRLMHTRYWLQIANNPYDHCYDFFFNSQRRREPARSVAIYTCKTDDLAFLEALVDKLTTKTKLSIVYVGFVDQRWLGKKTRIQRRPDHLE
ncbi:hypothetical protein AZI11_12855 (plasmid) [Levilactobacillus brevis]|nr:hypothetical protein AZI11_12855 [Levilactobacillus brevis]ARN96465.1 hypothetical protein AZI12_13280 [Levilactobacillus brevis]